MSFELDISVADEGWTASIPDPHALAEPAVAAALAEGSAPAGPLEISLLLGSDATLRELNRRYRGKVAPTNVLSFVAPELDPPPGIPKFLGDIAIARETVEREAAEAGKPFSAHLQHLIVHGVLHLLGYDHVLDMDANEMETREVAALAHIGVPNPYLGDAVLPA